MNRQTDREAQHSELARRSSRVHTTHSSNDKQQVKGAHREEEEEEDSLA